MWRKTQMISLLTLYRNFAHSVPKDLGLTKIVRFVDERFVFVQFRRATRNARLA
jgi:hypothetical protein